MKYTLLLILSIFVISCSAQTRLLFCVQVDSAGNCIKPAKEFGISMDGGTLSFLLRNDKGLKDTVVRFKIYYLDESGNETLTRTFEQETEANWTYSWQDVVFYDAGTYKVKAYGVRNREEDFLYSEIVKVYTR